MLIPKTALATDNFARPYRPYANARTAFAAFLRALDFQPGEHVLLPAYVGWSAREGSGVFDPVEQLGLAASFYRLDRRLQIDLEHLHRQLRTRRVKLLVLIHYFGHVDPSYAAAVDLARQQGSWVLEDEAHAMLTDLNGGTSGRLGDASIFSLHKLLPVAGGGLLLVPERHRELLERAPDGQAATGPWLYDLAAIAECRRRNARCLAELLPPLAEHLEPLWDSLAPGEVPQTFPVVIKQASRDDLYQRLNAAGFGVVSLYHTLISQIAQDEFPDAHFLSRRILNLPIHQDVSAAHLVALVEQLGALARALREPQAKGANDVGL